MRLLYVVARLTAFLPRRLQIALSREPAVIVDRQQLDPQVQLLRAFRRRRGVQYNLLEPTITAGRKRYRAEARIFNPRPTRVASVRDFELDGGLRVRHYRPDRADGGPLTVYFHGGGFVIGDLDTHDEPCRLLCRHSRAHVLSVDYRRAPEHPYPAANDDALAAFRWARANARSLGADPGRVAVGGDSAGAYLAAAVAMADTPFAQLLLYPPTGVDVDYPSRTLFDKGFFLSMADHAAFRAHYRPPPLTPTPAPALVVIAGFDILRDEAEAYARALPAAHILRYPGLGHGFIHMSSVATTARRAVREVGKEWGNLLACR